MCDPLTAIAATAMVAGTGMQVAGQNKAEKAQARAIRAETDRQDAFDRERHVQFDDRLGTQGREDQERQLGDLVGKRQESYTEAVQGRDAYVPGQSRAPQAVQGERARANTEASAASRQSAIARALLEGYGDLNTANAIAGNRAGGNLAMLSNLSRGSSGILPMEHAAAAHAGDGLSMGGNILTGLGNVGMMGANAGWFQPTAQPYGATGMGKIIKSADGRLVGGV